jgi:hypothetical protein
MSAAHHSESFLERWGTALVIVYGLIFLSCLVTFAPSW